MKTFYLSIAVIVLVFKTSFIYGEKNPVKDIDFIKVDNYTDRGTPFNSVINFLKWYSHNKKSINQWNAIDGLPGSKTKIYKINELNLKEFFFQLLKSGFVSTIYISDLKQKFDNADENLKFYPQSDGPVDDLEFDIIYGIMETSDISEHMEDIKIERQIIRGDKSFVAMRIGTHLLIKTYLSRYGNNWKIDHYLPKYIN